MRHPEERKPPRPAKPYPSRAATLYVGLDAAGKPTQFVVDCGLIHFDWPAPEDPAKSGPP